MHRTSNPHERIDFEFTSTDAFGSPQRIKTNSGEPQMQEESYITISISIPSELLAQVELSEGENRNEKLVRCIQTGYDILKMKKSLL